MLIERFEGHFPEIEAFSRDIGLHSPKTALKLVVGACQGIFGVDVEMPGEIYDGKQQITEFFLDIGCIPAANGGLQLPELLVDLQLDPFGIGPIKTHAARAFAQFLGPFQGR